MDVLNLRFGRLVFGGFWVWVWVGWFCVWLVCDLVVGLVWCLVGRGLVGWWGWVGLGVFCVGLVGLGCGLGCGLGWDLWFDLVLSAVDFG